jgi:hypothetical protein
MTIFARAGGQETIADFMTAVELARPDIGMNPAFFQLPPPWLMPTGWKAPLTLCERLPSFANLPDISVRKRAPPHDASETSSQQHYESQHTAAHVAHVGVGQGPRRKVTDIPLM